MGSSKMDSSAVYALFEELKQKMDELDKNANPNGLANLPINSDEIISRIEDLKVKISQPQFSEGQFKNLGQISAYTINKVNENFGKAFAELEAKIKPIDEKINQIKSQQKMIIRKEHAFSIDFRNSRAALTMISMGLIILLSFGGNIWQLNRNRKLMDNDLKYRYIESIDGISAENLHKLEDIFHFHRNKSLIKKIRQGVANYERRIEKAAKEEEAKRLK